MRPQQKSGRSRGNKNRNKGGGGGGGFSHSPNRVYESAGPEGKVRGTPQQIIDKYQALARDAQLSGDRVTAENFLQHAEHYVRILVSIQEAQGERQGQQPGFDRDDERDEDTPRFGRDPRDFAEQPQPRSEDFRREEPRREEPRREEFRRDEARRDAPRREDERREDNRREERRPRPPVETPAEAETASAPQPAPAAARPEPEAQPELPAFITAAAPVSEALSAVDGGPDIVETPESRAKPAERRPRKPRAKPAKPADETPAEAAE